MILLTEQNPEPNELFAVPEYPFECLIYDGPISCKEVHKKVIEIFLSLLIKVKCTKEKTKCNLITINIY